MQRVEDKKINVQCYCDVRRLECIVKFLVDKGLRVPIRASEALNAVITWVSEELTAQGKSRILTDPTEAIDNLSKLGMSVRQLRPNKRQFFDIDLKLEPYCIPSVISRKENNE